MVPLGTPERVGHRAGCHEHEMDNREDSDVSSSGEPDFTDCSSENKATIPGERVRRLAKGFEKLRRIRRRPIQPIMDPSSEGEPPGLNPSSEEEWPDPDYVDSGSEVDESVRMGAGGDSLSE